MESGWGTGWGHTKLASWMQVRAMALTPGGSPKSQEAQPPLPPLPEDRRQERLVELHTSFRELFTFFCTNATIHGTIRLVCSSHNRLKTASWGLLFVGALAALYWQFGLLFEQYWRYPVIMTVSVHSERKLFPSVTLCDMNPHRWGRGAGQWVSAPPAACGHLPRCGHSGSPSGSQRPGHG